MSLFQLKPTHSPVKAYYAALAQFHLHGHTTEGNTRSAFADLLKRCASPYDWHLVEEYQFKGTAKQPLRADGALVDSLTLVHGLWEAKDSADNLEREIKSKVAHGYPLTNILFQSPDRAVLYQDNRIALDCSLDKPENLVEILQLFFEHRQPHEVDWEEAVFKFAEKIPDLAEGVTKILNDEYSKNKDFQERFKAFAELCRQSINPSLTNEAIQKMLVQHLLTERVFRKVFNNNEFLQRNVIAAEIEKVIQSITAKHFSRDTFLKPLDRFYTAIEKAAESQTGYTEKQHFLNAVYEKFFQSFDKKQADTHGIVYTPQPIVDFMVRSVQEILKTEFGKSLSDEGVHILDPFTGTGNFITRIMQSIKKSRLPQKYANELHCNEVMLLPYYIASMNIEHAYSEALGEYRPFEGICLVDTFDLAEPKEMQFEFMSAENSARVQRQRSAPIQVVLGNPPYNQSQANENDANKNRKYRHMDRRVKETYVADSKATLLNKLSDPYVKAFRFATDRLGDAGGVVAFITNNGFLYQKAFDGMREHLMEDFTNIFVVNLGGDVRRNPKLSGTTHNVFGIQVGVAITILVRNPSAKAKRAQLSYVEMGEFVRRNNKLQQLNAWTVVEGVGWARKRPKGGQLWSDDVGGDDYENLLPLGLNESRGRPETEAMFRTYSPGVVTARDAWAYNFSSETLLVNMEKHLDSYQLELSRFLKSGKKLADYKLTQGDHDIKWTDRLLNELQMKREIAFDSHSVRSSLYRPFTIMFLYFDELLNQRRYQQHRVFPSSASENENKQIVVTGHEQSVFSVLGASEVACSDVGGRPGKCFSFFIYDEEGSRRKENVTDWALAQYRTHYADMKITKWDIFHSTYALLHHPEYRARYAANLKRELPRIPFPPDLHAFAAAGKRLMELHVEYEKQPEYPLEEIELPNVPWTLRVERMRLSKDKTEIRYNEALTLRGIPPAVFDYRLGNRSALEWVIDQYQVSTDKRSGITNDPNRPDDERYILRLIGQVITVSLETQQIIAALPTLALGD